MRKYFEPQLQRNVRPRAQPKSGGRRCPECGVLDVAGRWTWSAPEGLAIEALPHATCPACAAVREGRSAGRLELPLALIWNRDELLAMVRSIECAERETHPLERLVSVVLDDEGLRVTTTGLHLARRLAGGIGRRLHRRPCIRYAGGRAEVGITFTSPEV